MANARKRRVRKARRTVDRTERVKPTPESFQHQRVWRMQTLLTRGPDDGGLSAEQFEAALQIVEAFDAITRGLGFKPLNLERVGQSVVEMSPREIRLATIYFAWAQNFQRRCMVRAHVVVEWISDDRRIDDGAVPLLLRACDLWERHRSDHDTAIMAQRRRNADMAAA